MSNLILIVMCLGMGLLLQRNRQLPDSFALSLNSYVIYIALPALILIEIHHLHLSREALLPIVFAWLLMAASALFIWLLAGQLGWSRSVTGALMLTVPLGNTSFVGIPLIEAFLGKEAISYSILYDQFGSFVALNTYGSFIAAYYSGRAGSWKNLVRTIASFPPFIALVMAFLSMPLEFPGWLAEALVRISSTLVPVVMVAVGLQWRLRLERETLLPLTLGLLASLVLTPLLAMGLLHLFSIQGLVAQVIILESAMPAMISAGVLAINYQLAPRLAASLVGYGLLFSLLTTWLWRHLI